MSWTEEEQASIDRDAEHIRKTTSHAYCAQAVAASLRRIMVLEDRIMELERALADRGGNQ